MGGRGGLGTQSSIEVVIRKIIEGVPGKCIFDSHFILTELTKRFSDQYLSFAGRFAQGRRRPTLPAHGQIGRLVNRLNGKLIDKIGPAWSENIHRRPSRCTCWKKR